MNVFQTTHVQQRHTRRGIAAIWAVVVLSLMTAILTAVAAQMVQIRRTMDQRAQRTQTFWLARSGVELAAARLLANPAGYAGETAEPIPESQVRVTVQAMKDQPNTYRITSEARYPTGVRHPVVQTVVRDYRRIVEGKQTKLKAIEFATKQ